MDSPTDTQKVLKKKLTDKLNELSADSAGNDIELKVNQAELQLLIEKLLNGRE